MCYVCRYASVNIMPELKKNILHFGYGINSKYEGMVAHSFDRFYVVTKIILPTISDLMFSTIHFDERCDYLKEENGCDYNSKEDITDLRLYCNKIVPFIHYYRNKFFLIIAPHIIL